LKTVDIKIKNDEKNPGIILKIVGDNLAKVLSATTDYIMYLSFCIAITIAAGCNNIIGVDQEGEIVF
jgi:hypothetical protein